MFYIIALPRSRTYWLSRFLSYAGKVMTHEGMPETGKVIGDSSTSPLEAPAVMDVDKCIIIERPIEEVIESLGRLFTGFDCTEAIEKQKQALDKLYGERIPYDEINDNLDHIWKRVHGTETPKGRIDKFMNKHLENHKIISDVRDYLELSSL